MSVYRKTVRTMAVVSGLALALTACAAPAPQLTTEPDAVAEMKPVVVRVNEIGPETGAPARALKAFMEYATEASDGKITFDPYYSATLAPPAESLAAITSGLTDMGFFGAAFNPQQLPVSFWATNVARDVIGPGHPGATVVGSPATNDLYQTNADLLAEFAAASAVPLMVMHSGPFPLLCVDPVATTAQAEGKVVSTFGSPWKEEMEAIGMTNASVAIPELYEALQRGVVDCVSSAANNHVNLGLMEIAKNLTLVDGGAGSGSGYAMNKSFWDGLEPAARDIMIEAKASFVTAYVRESLAVLSKLISEADRLGVTIHDPEELDEAIHAQSAKVSADLIMNAPAGVTDPEAFIESMEGYRVTWADWVSSELGVEPAGDVDLDELVRLFADSADAVDYEAYEKAIRVDLTELGLE